MSIVLFASCLCYDILKKARVLPLFYFIQTDDAHAKMAFN